MRCRYCNASVPIDLSDIQSIQVNPFYNTTTIALHPDRIPGDSDIFATPIPFSQLDVHIPFPYQVRIVQT